MAKDLIIGGCSNYDWSQLRNWVKSIKDTGFSGDIVLVGTNVTEDTIQRLVAAGVKLMIYGTKNAQGGFDAPANGIEPHVERFFYIWNYLSSVEEDYRYVITTDTRDVIFQKNPSDWCEGHLQQMYSFAAGSEGLSYQDEPWGSENYLQTFGPYFHHVYKEKMIYNVGVIAGYSDIVRDLMLMIFQMSVNRPIRICDQATFNFIINQEPYATEALLANHDDCFSTNLGTTSAAITAGAGQIGALYKEDPSTLDEYLKNYKEIQPIIDDEGFVMRDHEDPKCFTIVHQYDRVPGLKALIDERYRD